ncbi:hypothetical protein PUN28_020571 [Cardiocondyla obscurior]|uniref:Uncharacterized protein n=1 Tax=Cardiocondyla obscurior TaxID=286306 RepID=A0AAW2E6N2_9HYME
MKGVGCLRQQDGGHGSRNPLRCVTTHLPKQLALKMDGAEASSLYSAVSGKWGGRGQGVGNSSPGAYRPPRSPDE